MPVRFLSVKEKFQQCFMFLFQRNGMVNKNSGSFKFQFFMENFSEIRNAKKKVGNGNGMNLLK